MNSLQLVSKIRSKTEDLTQNITDLLSASHDFNNLDKELLKKQCADLYELILKLKSNAELIEEKNTGKKINAFEHAIVPIVPEIVAQPIKEPTRVIPEEKPIEPKVNPTSFQEVLNWGTLSDETLDDLSTKITLDLEPPVLEKPKIVDEEKPVETHTPIEINIEKATENKRIQYTVMPDIVEPKAIPLHNNIKDKPLTYNEKIAQEHPPVLIPLADKTIEAPIENIKSAINLNKKIAFVKELFNDNVVEYAKSIERLNSSTDLKEALLVQNELKQLHQWDSQNELVMELDRLIRRRFS